MRRVHAAVLAWCRRRFVARRPPAATAALNPFADLDAARLLVAAIDRGGVPLNPARVSAIARQLGLEVSPRAPVEQTVERIRACLRRADRQAPLN